MDDGVDDSVDDSVDDGVDVSTNSGISIVKDGMIDFRLFEGF